MFESKNAQPISEPYKGYDFSVINLTINNTFRVHAVVLKDRKQVYTVSPLTNGDRDEAVEEVRLLAKHWIDQQVATEAGG